MLTSVDLLNKIIMLRTKRLAHGLQCGYMLNSVMRCRRKTRIMIQLLESGRGDNRSYTVGIGEGIWASRCSTHRKRKYLGD